MRTQTEGNSSYAGGNGGDVDFYIAVYCRGEVNDACYSRHGFVSTSRGVRSVSVTWMVVVVMMRVGYFVILRADTEPLLPVSSSRRERTDLLLYRLRRCG